LQRARRSLVPGQGAGVKEVDASIAGSRATKLSAALGTAEVRRAYRRTNSERNQDDSRLGYDEP